ncbi:MAG: Hsp20 family protein [Alphaproteobacteria bacterium]
MTNLDLSPLFHATVGFDRLAKLLDAAMSGRDSSAAFPPYNIEKLGDDTFRITMAVAGFTGKDVEATVQDNMLVVAGTAPRNDEGRELIHRGIAGRSFERRFVLADFVRVSGAALADGLLHIDLVREVPEAAKPQRIEIKTGGPKSGARTVEGKAA